MPILGSIGGASEGAYKGNLDDYPNPFSFENVVDAEPGEIYRSGIATITGLNYKAKVTIGVGASVSVNGGAFSTESQYVSNNDTIEIRLRTIKTGQVTDFSRNNTTTVAVGRSAVDWTVRTRDQDILPNPVFFNTVTNALVAVAVTSNQVTISGIEPNYPTTVTSGIGSFSINGSPPVTSGLVFNGDVVYLVRPILPETPTSYTEDTILELTIGTYVATWVVSPLAPDLTPDQFSFVNLVKQDTDATAPGISSSYISNTITVTGINSITTPKFKIPISIATTSTNTSVGYDINESGNFTSVAGEISGGDKVRVRVVTPPTFLTDANATLNVGGISSTWRLRTRYQPYNTIPDPYSFNDILNSVYLSNSYESNAVTLSGISTGKFGTAFIVSGTGQFKVDRLGSTVRSYGTAPFAVQNGDQITLRMTSDGNYGGTVNTEFSVNGQDFTDTVGFRSDTWTITNVPTPDAPVIEFSAGNDPAANIQSQTIRYNETVTLSWRVTGAIPGAVTSVSINQGIGSVSFAGSRQVTLTTNGVTTFTLTATGPGGTTTATVSFTIPPAPVINSFTSSPNPIVLGESTTLSWNILNQVETVTINNGGGSYTEALGTATVTPSSDVFYTLTATGPGGSRSQVTPVDVIGIPTISFTADDPNLDAGTSTTIRWTTTDTYQVSIDNGVGSASTIGTRTVSPSSSTTYTLTATGLAGSNTRQLTVNVFPLPSINSFSASPSQVAPNGSTTLSWSTSNAVSASIDGGVGSVPTNGSRSVNVGSSAKTYTLTVTGGGGATRSTSTTVTILPAPTISFYASPTSINRGSSTTLYWSTTNASSVSISGIGGVGVNGSYSVAPSSSTSYTATATNATGSASASTYVSVTCTEVQSIYRYGGGSCGYCPPNTCRGTYWQGTDGNYYPNPYYMAGRIGNVNSVWINYLSRPCPSALIDYENSVYASFDPTGNNYAYYISSATSRYSRYYVGSVCGSPFTSLAPYVYCLY